MFVRKWWKRNRELFCVGLEAALSGDHWQWAVLLLGSAPGMKPLLRLLGLGGEPRRGVASALRAGSMTEQLFCGSRGWTSIDLGMTDACRSPSARSGGLTRAGPVGVASGLGELGELGLGGGEGLRALWSSSLDSACCGTSWSGGVTSFSSGTGLVDSRGGSCCMLLCLEVPEAGISQLSVRRLEPSCIRLVATTAFMAACRHKHAVSKRCYK